MAPRKALKPDAAPEAGTPEAAPKAKTVKPRAKKALAAPEPAPQPETAAAPEPAKAARKKAPKAAPVAASEPAAPETVKAAPASVKAASGDLLTDNARAVLEAIHDGLAVELLFHDAETNPPRTFEPRQLVYDTFAKGWYVWGWDRRYNAERHHLLDLIAQVGPVEGMGRAAQGPYKEGTPANLVGGWLGGEPIHVKAVLFKQWIFAVRQAPAPFPEFKLEEIEEGKAQVTFIGTDLRAISRWAMQFGDGIQVLEPQRLQDRIKQVGIAWGGKALAERPAQPPPQQQPSRRDHGHKQEHRSEPREPREHRSESREPREPRAEAKEAPEPRRNKPEAPRFSQEAPRPAAKPGKIEIRIDRL